MCLCHQAVEFGTGFTAGM